MYSFETEIMTFRGSYSLMHKSTKSGKRAEETTVGSCTVSLGSGPWGHRYTTIKLNNFLSNGYSLEIAAVNKYPVTHSLAVIEVLLCEYVLLP